MAISSKPKRILLKLNLLFLSLTCLMTGNCVAKAFSSIKNSPTEKCRSFMLRPKVIDTQSALPSSPNVFHKMKSKHLLYDAGDGISGSEGNPKSSGLTIETKSSETTIVFSALATSLALLVLAARIGILRGALDASTGLFGTYSNGMIFRDLVASLSSAGLAFLVVKLITLGYDKGLYDSKISRKLSHTISAPCFILVYPIFSAADGARYFAAVVTMVNAIRLYLAATGDEESSLALSVSRSGDKKEALGGPFIYVLLLSFFIVTFWRSTPVGIVATATMAAGDGMADLVGRRLGGNNKWWFSESKSIAGTTAFAVSASFASFALLKWLQYTSCLQMVLSPADLAARVVIISVCCAFVELLPVGDDNITVPMSAALLAAFLLK